MTAGKLMKIGDVAKKLGVAVSTVRKYEAAGVVLPVRTICKHRLFSEDDLFWLGCVRDMITHKGMTLEAIKRMVAIVPCWEMRKCPMEERVKCPAYTDDATPCWLLNGTKFDCFTADCRTCVVYRSVTHCENMKVLLTEIAYSRG
jgi:MerR family transcriptional regulator/heat shock protein HspR